MTSQAANEISLAIKTLESFELLLLLLLSNSKNLHINTYDQFRQYTKCTRGSQTRQELLMQSILLLVAIVS